MIKLIALCVIGAAFLVFFKQSRPEFGLLLKLSVLAFIGVAVLLTFSSVASEIQDIQNLFGENGALVKIQLLHLSVLLILQRQKQVNNNCSKAISKEI